MLILAIDTSWKHGGIALARGDDKSFHLIATAPLLGGTFSAQLVPQIADLLASNKLHKQDLDAFAAASGPGSFTGLRVGLAAIKGLAEVLRRPIATATVLEALAEAGQGRVVAALDAGRDEVFAGDYHLAGAQVTTHREWLAPLCDFAADLPPDATVVTPDERVAELARSRGLSVSIVPRPGPDAFARIGLRKLLAGQALTPEQLDANYIRRSDAELFSAPDRRR